MGATPVIVKSESPTFALPIEQIKKAVNANTKAIIINYPNNPTGASLSQTDREFLNNLCEEKISL
ncbi:aminotransferase class I/II-fold pyridoxal phosphate-dependent enzyme [Lactobacillus sp. R2/2]|nr:aminotransferase class I/II-fold pyridoxal phosphate-dependent enzyme [Lactobacillus sp. R2/2]